MSSWWASIAVSMLVDGQVIGLQQRVAKVEALIGDASKARELLGWKAETNADRLAQIMVDADIEQMRHLLRD